MHNAALLTLIAAVNRARLGTNTSIPAISAPCKLQSQPSRCSSHKTTIPSWILRRPPSRELTMPANKHHGNGNALPPEQSRIARILKEASQNVISQSHRILPDLALLQGLYQTFLAGGVIDDRKYLVCVNPASRRGYFHMRVSLRWFSVPKRHHR